MPNGQFTFDGDQLGRRDFADLLVTYLIGLASASVAPSGRVLAVDAPWGSGKSWVAKRLRNHVATGVGIGACVYVDAYEFDHHHDPFAVIASAIANELSHQSPEIRGFVTAAKDVLYATLPALAKGALKVSTAALGIDAGKVAESIVDASSDIGEKAVDKMMKSFATTQNSGALFREKLESLANASPNGEPMLIIIDELDRCRPSFALEMLERVKHLFDVPNVVFLLFIHKTALHSAIQKTYGGGVNPAEYLRKFIALTVELPSAEKFVKGNREREGFLRRFLDVQYPLATTGVTQDDLSFRDAVVEFAPLFGAGFREVESVMLLGQLIKGRVRLLPVETAYGIFLRVCDFDQFLVCLADKSEGFATEAKRTGQVDDADGHYLTYLREIFHYCASPTSYKRDTDPNRKSQTRKLLTDDQCRHGHSDLIKALIRLKLEFVRF